jgi:DNA-binding HxlR family transcriptional regulator
MSERSGGSSEPAPGGLDGRVLSTLHELHGRIAFSGLRRVLRAHPESLSRSLRRLEREGLVERVEGGYRALAAEPTLEAEVASELRPMARVRLPWGVSPEAVLGRLSGHWFGSLRWVGVIDRPSGRLLAWARRDGSGYVLLGIRSGMLQVYVPGDVSREDPGDAEDAAYEVLEHAVEALRPTTHVTGAAFLAAEASRPSAAWAGDN